MNNFENEVKRHQKQRWSNAALMVSLIVIILPAITAFAAAFELITFHYDSVWPLQVQLFGGGTLCFLSMALSAVVHGRYKTRRALLAFVLSILAIPIGLVVTFFAAMSLLALHPI